MERACGEEEVEGEQTERRMCEAADRDREGQAKVRSESEVARSQFLAKEKSGGAFALAKSMS